MGSTDMGTLESDVEAGIGEEGATLFLLFSIAASMLSRSAMSGYYESTGLGLSAEGGVLYTVGLKETAVRAGHIHRDQESAFRKREVIG